MQIDAYKTYIQIDTNEHPLMGLTSTVGSMRLGTVVQKRHSHDYFSPPFFNEPGLGCKSGTRMTLFLNAHCLHRKRWGERER